jgi:hypothetical protein
MWWTSHPSSPRYHLDKMHNHIKNPLALTCKWRRIDKKTIIIGHTQWPATYQHHLYTCYNSLPDLLLHHE